MDTRPRYGSQSAADHSRMSVILQGPICEEMHGMGLDLSENGSAETMTDEGDRIQVARYKSIIYSKTDW